MITKENYILNSHDSEDSADKYHTQQPFNIRADASANPNRSIYNVNMPEETEGRNTAYIVNSPSKIFSKDQLYEASGFELPKGQSRQLPSYGIGMQISDPTKKMAFPPSKLSGYYPVQMGQSDPSSFRGIEGFLLAHDSTKNSLTGKKGPAFLKHYHELKAANSTQYAFQASERTKRNFKQTQEKLGIVLQASTNASSPMF